MAVITYKCPNCGGGLIFDPETQKFKCEYCLSGFTEKELENPADARTESPDIQSGPAILMYSCPSCGAEIVAEETTAATFCYYCHNPVVLSGKLDGAYEPDSVIPFELDQEKAEERFKDWIGKKRYVPGDFYSPSQIERLEGIYYPYWTYSCTVAGRLKAEGIRQKSTVSGSVRYIETSRFAVERRGSMKVDHVARMALKKADRQLSERVLPFNMEKLRPFTAGYLSGFRAERRDREQEEFTGEVEAEVKGFAKEALRSSVSGYDQVNIREQESELQNGRWNYSLFPVWVLTYKDRKSDKIYYFAMNGQNGKICGVLPVDRNKLAMLFLSIFFPMLFLLLIGGYLI